MIVYTKTGRYVLVFKLGHESQYDDVVEIIFGGGSTGANRPLRLLDQSFKTVLMELKTDKTPAKPAGVSKDIPVLLSTSELRIESEELEEAIREYPSFRCEGCRITRNGKAAQLACISPIVNLSCKGGDLSLSLKRKPS
jgi:hypothetical protein